MDLRPASPQDIPFIVELETHADFSPFINSWAPERHGSAMADSDFRYFIFDDLGEAKGYAMLRDFASHNNAVQLCRLALAKPGSGRGRQACLLVMKYVFEDHGAHRLYLDLFEDNYRAEHLYRSLGFQHEGVLRDAERRGSVYRSLKVMSMLEGEYKRLHRDGSD